MTFFIAKDGSYFSKNAMELITKIFPAEDLRMQAPSVAFSESDFLQWLKTIIIKVIIAWINYKS